MKKLIVEIADKYADAASMTFIGTNYDCRSSCSQARYNGNCGL